MDIPYYLQAYCNLYLGSVEEWSIKDKAEATAKTREMDISGKAACKSRTKE